MITPGSPPRPKLVFVNRYFFPDTSATSQMLSDLAFGLARRGVPVLVICSRQRYDDPRALLAPRETIGGVHVHRVWTTRFGRGRLPGRAADYATFYLASAARMLLLVARGDTLVAETDPPLISIVAAAVAAAKRARLVNWLHDVFPEIATLLGANPLPPWIGGQLLALRDRSLRAAASNVVLGSRMRERLEAHAAPASLCVIENWAAWEPAGAPDPASVAEPAGSGGAPRGLRARLGLEGRFVVGYSGNLGRAHEWQTLLGAARLCAGDPDVVFLMIGAGAGMTALERAVLENGLGNFHFLPLQPRGSLADTLAAADVHWVSLLPELEGLIVPSKLYGILAAARPVLFVGDPDGEVARVVVPARAGFGVAIGQSAALAGLLMRLKSDQGLREEMGANARRLYCERYTAGIALERWLALLQPMNGLRETLRPDNPDAAAGIRPLSDR